MAIFDFKKEFKELYKGETKPTIVAVPPISFLLAEGYGDPNTSFLYKHHVEVLYGLSYTIKMSKMGDRQAPGYFDYVVPPLEGLWWFDEEHFSGEVTSRKEEFKWIMMLRQPDFVTEEVIEDAKTILAKKKPKLDLSIAKLNTITEGLCAQILHIGPYDTEAASIARLDDFIGASAYQTVMSGFRQHHEIYLSDPNRTAPDKLKTLIRHPIEAADQSLQSREV